jgi:hypothetical protein
VLVLDAQLEGLGGFHASTIAALRATTQAVS